MNITSNRRYQIAVVTITGIELIETDLQDIITNTDGFEVYYAIKESFDYLLDLNKGQWCTTHFRDSKDKLIVISRIK